MNIFNLFESPKLGAPSNRPGAQDIGDQHSPSPIGSGTSKREAKKKPVTMMGVGVKESKITEIWEPLTEGQVPNFLDDDFYAYDPETKEIKGTWSHKSVGRRHSEHKAQTMGWQVVSGMKARSLGLHYADKDVEEGLGKGVVINKDDLVDIYIKGRGKNNIPIQKKVGAQIPNSKANAFIAKVAEKYGLNPKAFVYGPSGDMAEGNLQEFAPGDGNSGRWYSDDDLADIVGEDWYEFDVSHEMGNIGTQGERARIFLAREAEAYLNDRGYNVNVLDVQDQGDNLSWYISGSLMNEQGVVEGSVQDKLHQRHQELRKKSGLPDPDYYKELKATYDLPDEERYAKAAELKKKYNVKEGILDRAAPKMPKPRNPAEKVLTAKRTSGAAGKHVNKKRQAELQPKHRGRDELDEGWKSAVAGAALAGAAALGGGAAQAGDLEQQIGPLPVMATISIQLPDGSTKTIKKDLGHEYDYRIDDAKKDIENILDKKGIKKYSIHLDRYKDNTAYLDRDAMSKSQAPDYRSKTDYVDNKPYQPKDGKGDYMDKTPYKASSTKVNYLDKAKSGEFRDMANYESIEEMDRRGFLKAMGGAALAGAGLSAADAAAQQMDTMARVIMVVNGEQVERVINLGQVSSPQAAERALANELQARGIDQFQIQLERGAPPKTAPIDTRPRPYGARSIAGPGGVVDTAGQVVGDVNSGDWRGAAQKGWKTYQNNKNADMGAVGRAEVKDRIIRGVVGGLGLDESELNEEMERHLYQLGAAGYDIISETEAIKGADGKRCWKGKRYAGTKNGKDICVDVNEEKKGLYYYVNRRKEKGISRPKGHSKAPSAQDWKDAAKTAKK